MEKEDSRKNQPSGSRRNNKWKSGAASFRGTCHAKELGTSTNAWLTPRLCGRFITSIEMYALKGPLIADILKALVAGGGLRHVRALRCETAIKDQGLSCVIGWSIRK
jgi:hypothetical protein